MTVWMSLKCSVVVSGSPHIDNTDVRTLQFGRVFQERKKGIGEYDRAQDTVTRKPCQFKHEEVNRRIVLDDHDVLNIYKIKFR